MKMSKNSIPTSFLRFPPNDNPQICDIFVWIMTVCIIVFLHFVHFKLEGCHLIGSHLLNRHFVYFFKGFDAENYT